MNKEQIKQYNIELYQVYLEKAEAKAEYSIKRFDILTITLSSGGLVLALNFYKTFMKDAEFELAYLSYSWMFFSIAIISNLLSQITGLLANKFDINATKVILESIDEGVEVKSNCLDCYKDIFNVLTIILNISSFTCLSIAIILLTIFIN